MPNIRSILGTHLYIIIESTHGWINTCKELYQTYHIEELAGGDHSKGNSRAVSDSSDQNSSFSTCLNRFPVNCLKGPNEIRSIHVVNTQTGHPYS